MLTAALPLVPLHSAAKDRRVPLAAQPRDRRPRGVPYALGLGALVVAEAAQGILCGDVRLLAGRMPRPGRRGGDASRGNFLLAGWRSA
jgi:hypothetical protein